jgi:hypothetical protein
MPVFTDPLYQAVSGVPNSPTIQPSFCDPMVFGLIPPYAMSHQMHPPVIANSFRQSHPGTAPGKGMHSYNAYSSTSPSYPCQNLRRCILIQNLNPTATEHDLLDFLQESVAIEKCEILPPHTTSNSQTTRSRLTARVTLRSAEDAKRVVALYNNTIFMRFRIRVKVDRGAPHTFSYDIAPDQHHSNTAELPTSVGRAAQMEFTPSQTETLSPDSDEQTRKSESLQCKVTDPCPEAKLKSKSVDICRPLVVNGSGVGGRTAVGI